MNYTQWLEARRESIGGSDMAAIMGLSNYMTPADVVRSKLEPPNPEAEMSAEQRRGLTLEPIARVMLAHAAGVAVQGVLPEEELIRDADGLPLHASIDGWATDPQKDRPRWPIEIKVPRSFVLSRWRKEGLPASIIIQCQHNLGVTDEGRLLFAAMDVDNWAILHWWIQRDEELIEELRRRASEFWTRYVEAGIYPEDEPNPLEGEAGLEVATVGGEADRITAGPEWTPAILELREARELLDEAQALYSERKAAFAASMGLGALVHPLAVVYNRQTAGRSGLDSAAAKREYEYMASLLAKSGAYSPKDWSVFVKKGKPSVTFRPYFKEERHG